MIKPLAIIAGEPNSISSEVIFKTWKLKKKYKTKPFFIIGNYELLDLQRKKLKFKIPIKKLNKNFKIKNIDNKMLYILDVPYAQKKPFDSISVKSNNYIFHSFDKAIKLAKEKKICGIINCPVSKESLFNKKHQGITEYLSKKTKSNGKEVMLIYNKNLAVCPITTHIPLSKVSKSINKYIIVKKVLVINKFYKKFFKKKPVIGILGLNPHNFNFSYKQKKNDIIEQAIKKLNKLKIKAEGPIVADSSFMMLKKYKFDVIVGMYHDQVLTPFKAIYRFDAINITLGLPFIRVSPDHGTAENIIGKNIANPKSLIESIKFFNNIN
jgi:4-hydroxythreonine-4-phosphate dehydrogenase